MLDDYNLHKRWGVPFEVEMQIEAGIRNERNESCNVGIWIAISHLADMPDAEAFIPELIRKVKLRYKQCLELMEEYDLNRDVLRPMVEKMFNH